jgi:hypothetical protein
MHFSIAIKYPDSNQYQYIDNTIIEVSKWNYEKNIDINQWLNHKFNQESWTSHIIYNEDQSISKSNGILVWNDHSIGWLIHSVPNWPININDKLPESEFKYGHTFLYIILPSNQLLNIIDQLKLMQVNVTSTNNYDFVHRKRAPSSDKLLRTLTISPDIYHISKHSKCFKNIYKDILSENKICKCRSFGKPKLIDNSILNLSEILLFDKNISDTKDKSKWAISVNEEDCWVAFTDLNNILVDSCKAGGAIVIKLPNIWKLMNSL